MTRELLRVAGTFGVDLVKGVRSIAGVPQFARDLIAYRKLNSYPTFSPKLRDLYPALGDSKGNAGTVGGHYFHQDLWAARRIYARRPEEHFDIGSRIDGFVAHLLTFMPVTMIDIRPVDHGVEGLTAVQDDATALRGFADNSIRSLSTLHVAEHFGLGRYSDPIDPSAAERFMRALCRVLAPGGWLYFSVPVGRERVCFNAHRVFAPATIIQTMEGLALNSFSYVDDRGDVHFEVEPSAAAACKFGCGLFEFTKV